MELERIINRPFGEDGKPRRRRVVHQRRRGNVKGKRPRDSQRAKVYRADTRLHGATERVELASALARCNRILTSAWCRKNYPAAVGKLKRVADGRGRRSAYGNAHEIGLPVWSRSEAIMLHELAHVVMCRLDLDNRAYAWHGPEFCRVYLQIVEHELGFKTRQKLARYFREERVKVATVNPGKAWKAGGRNA